MFYIGYNFIQISDISDEAKEELADLVLMRKLSRDLMEGSRTCGIEHINSALRTSEIQWEELREVLAQREMEANLREQQQCHLEELNDMAIRWLQEMDARLRKLTPAALDLTVISKQTESLEVF